jgi:predicted anti-sigma-YlaC factor YlaD
MIPENKARKILRGILTTRADEIDCEAAFEELDRFGELALSKQEAAELLPLVQQHLERCPDCREEFEALLRALQARE